MRMCPAQFGKLKINESGSIISKLVSNYAISNLCSAISKLCKFANCVEHIHVQLMCEKPKKFPNKTVLHSGDSFEAIAFQL